MYKQISSPGVKHKNKFNTCNTFTCYGTLTKLIHLNRKLTTLTKENMTTMSTHKGSGYRIFIYFLPYGENS